MWRKFTADRIYPVSSAPVSQSVLIADSEGRIMAIEPLSNHDPASVEHFRGALVPGFVNTHCHLELSHMKGLVDTGTGLIPFITDVVTKRNFPAEVIAEAIQRAEQEMLEGGIVAVGDISNTSDTFFVKAQGRLRYYTFVETFDFLQDAGAEKAINDWKPIYEAAPTDHGSQKALVPHAPYSVSPTLFKKIAEANAGRQVTVSIHNQETPDENELFLYGRGGFYAFYDRFGFDLSHFEPIGQTSIHFALKYLDPEQRTLFVHNTLTTADDIRAAHAWSPNVFWATCPNANLYIENRLPKYRYFLDTGARLTLGTDSLTSNWQLSLLEEMKTIARYQSYVPFEDLLRWATLNGAQALGFDDTLGSFDAGKKPGILLLEGLTPDYRLTTSTTVRRLL
ncbi:MAG: amidohydrolase family protein [Saprospiraceae bacterium]|nr:amidohydrolase family protein [Saprospiraceae bacterium]MDW8484455.1 amidohydrolase family protein [Saprospiraceae bacterium]